MTDVLQIYYHKDKQASVFLSSDTRPTPAQMHEVCDALAHRPDRADVAPFWRSSAQHIGRAQVFDFGEVREPLIRSESMRGGPLMGEGYLRPPYESCIYHYTLTDFLHPDQALYFTSGRLRYLTSIIEVDRLVDDEEVLEPVPGGLPEVTSRYAVSDWIRLPEPEEFGLRRVNSGHFWLCAGAGLVEVRRNGSWSGWLLEGVSAQTMTEDTRTTGLGSLADGIAAFCMMLCTKNIRLRPEHPSPKLNAKRAKSGKPALVTVTHVDTQHYFAAAAHTERGGTHASPVPHLRRGHIRTYRDGHRTWIKPMLVNCRSLDEIKPRDHYSVKTEETHL